MENGRLARTHGEDRVHHRLSDGSGERNTGSRRRRGKRLGTLNPAMGDVDPAVLLLKSDGGGRVGVGEAELARPPPSSQLLGLLAVEPLRRRGGLLGRRRRRQRQGFGRRPLGLYVYRCRYGQGL